MPSARSLPTTGPGSMNALLAVVAAFAALLGVFELSMFAAHGVDGWPWPLAMPTAIFWIYVAAGLTAWRLRPRNGTGVLIIVAGLMLFISSFSTTGLPPALGAFAAVSDSLALPAVAHMLLAYPTGRLRDRLSLQLVVALYVVTLVLGAPAYLFSPEGQFPPFAVADLPLVVAVSGWARVVVGNVLMVVVAVVLFRRLRTAEPQHRRVLAWLYSYGIFAVVGLPWLAVVLDYLLTIPPDVRGQLQFLLAAGIPVFFALGVVRGGFARTGELDELSAWLGRADAGQAFLGVALANALGDPTLRLWFAAPDGMGFVDAEGEPAPALIDARRARQEIELDGRTVGAIDYDSALLHDEQTVASAGRVVAIAVERERLTRELLATQRAVLESRERLVEAADRERRRIARDLHDGLQAQLVLLALEAQQIAASQPEQVRMRSTQLRREIDAAAAELRSLVHDLVPAGLIERGLAAAAADLADRMPIPATLDVDVDRRLSQAVESTAYYVLAEALTNMVKHSAATAVAISLRLEDDLLRLTVADNGRGGAAPSKGMGLSGIRDRAETLGGRVRIESDPDAGTVVTMEVPCGS